MLAKIHESLLSLAVSITDLTEDPFNARSHPEENVEAIARSLEEFGQDVPLVVQKKGMVVRKGNGRLKAARRLGWTHLAALVVDEPDLRAAARAVADNRVGELARWDEKVLAKLLADFRAKGGGLAGTPVVGFSDGEVEKLLAKVRAREDRAAQGETGGSPTVTTSVPVADRPEGSGPSPQAPAGSALPQAAEARAPDGAPAEGVRLVPLFIRSEDFEDFQARLTALEPRFGTQGVTDTVLEALRRCAEIPWTS